MSWGESVRLALELVKDPGSHVHAAMAGWDRPVSSEALVLMDLYDVFTAANFKKPQPYPRPWPTDGGTDKRRRGDAAGRTPEQVRDILNAFGHSLD